MPLELLPNDLNTLPGDFAVMSYIFESMLFVLFLISMLTTITYIKKIIKVFKWHRSEAEVYKREVLPSVRTY